MIFLQLIISIFVAVVDKTDYFYGDVLVDNKYNHLIQDKRIVV